jgi:hypothetical protein
MLLNASDGMIFRNSHVCKVERFIDHGDTESRRKNGSNCDGITESLGLMSICPGWVLDSMLEELLRDSVSPW